MITEGQGSLVYEGFSSLGKTDRRVDVEVHLLGQLQQSQVRLVGSGDVPHGDTLLLQSGLSLSGEVVVSDPNLQTSS